MLDGEHLLGELILTPNKAAGLGVVATERRAQHTRKTTSHPSTLPTSANTLSASTHYPELDMHSADGMPHSVPERTPLLEVEEGDGEGAVRHPICTVHV